MGRPLGDFRKSGGKRSEIIGSAAREAAELALGESVPDRKALAEAKGFLRVYVTVMVSKSLGTKAEAEDEASRLAETLLGNVKGLSKRESYVPVFL